MGAFNGSPKSGKETLRIADLCQAIENGQIEPAIEGNYYRISAADARTVAGRGRETLRQSALLPELAEVGWETASEMGRLAQSGPCS